MKKSVFSTTLAIVLAVVVLAVAVPINLIAGRLDFTWDMTPKSVFELTQKTKDVLNGLDKDVYIYPLFELEELRDDKDNARQLMPLYNIYKAFDEYEHITVISADPGEDKGVKILENVDIPPELVIERGDTLVVCNGLVKNVIGGKQIVIDADNGNVQINTENDLTSAISYVAKGIKPVVYFLTGHGEAAEEEYTNLADNMNQSGYVLKFIDLTDGSPVPVDAEVLLCVDPKTDIPDIEYEQIMEFIKNGGNIQFFIPPNSSDETYTNITNIMGNFGIGMNYDTVSDEVYYAPNNKETILADFVAYTPATYAADGSIEYEGDEVDLTSELISRTTGNSEYTVETYMPLSRSFYTTSSGGNVKFAQLLTSHYDNSTYYAVGTPTGGPYKDADIITGSVFTLAAYAVNKDQNDAAMLVYGANILDNTATQSAYFMNPVYLFLISLTWLHETDIDLQIPAKIITYDTMTFQNQKEADRMIIFLVLIPIIVSLFGLLAWYKRGRISG